MATGTKSLKEMADILDKKGMKISYRSGKQFKMKPQTLQRIFRNKFYTGKVVSKKYNQEVLGQHAPMISEDLFYRIQAVLDGRNVNIARPLASRNRDNPEFPLRRIVKCSGCGGSLTSGWCKGKKNKYAYYFCQKWCGKGGSIRIEDIERETTTLLRTLSMSERSIDLFCIYLRKTYFQRITTLQKRRESADEELRKLYETRQSLIQKNLDGIYSDEIFKEQNKILEERIAIIQMTKSDDVITKYNIENITLFIKEKFKDLAKTYENSNLQQKRMLLCSIFPSGLVWGYPGYLNNQISACYQIMTNENQQAIRCGRRERIRTSGLGNPNPAH